MRLALPSSLALALVALHGACTAPRPAVDSSLPIADRRALIPLSGHAVLQAGAPLYAMPKREALVLPDSRIDGQQRFVEYRVVEDRGEWVKLRSLSNERVEGDAHCYGRSEKGIETLELVLWARRSDLLPVLVAEHEGVFDNESKVHLEPGLVVRAEGGASPQAHYQLFVGALSFHLELPNEKVGLSFEPSPGASLELGRANHYVPRDAIDGGKLRIGDGSRVEVSEDERIGPSVEAGEPRGRNDILVTHRAHCAELEMLLDKARLEEQVGAWGYSFGSKVAAGAVALAPAGSKLYWSGGLVAGRVKEATMLADEVEGESGRRCFLVGARPLREGQYGGATARMTLCVDAAVLE